MPQDMSIAALWFVHENGALLPAAALLALLQRRQYLVDRFHRARHRHSLRRLQLYRSRLEFRDMLEDIDRHLAICPDFELDQHAALALRRVTWWAGSTQAALALLSPAGIEHLWPRSGNGTVKTVMQATLDFIDTQSGTGDHCLSVYRDGHVCLFEQHQHGPIQGWLCMTRVWKGKVDAMLCLGPFAGVPEQDTSAGRNAQAARLRILLDTLADAVRRRHAEQQLSTMRRRMELAMPLESIGTMASGISHNFNNILNAIRANAETVDSMIDDASARQHIEQIKRAGDQGAELVQAILSTGSERGQRARLIEANELLKQSIVLLNVWLPSQVRLMVHYTDTPLYLRGTFSSLQQVIFNLALNAAQAMAMKGTIEVGLSAPDHRRIQLSVKDQGVGIPDAHREKIFTAFFTTRAFGTGLGLATARQIIEDHDGSIDVSSAQGHGTTFTVELPAEPVQWLAEDGIGALSQVPPHGIVLLLSSAAARLEHLEDIVAASGHEPIGHTRLPAALACLAEQDRHIDLILVDEGPAEETAGTVAALHRARPDLPMLLISSAARHPALTALGRTMRMRMHIAPRDSDRAIVHGIEQLLSEMADASSAAE
jgi:signal transduction histidine kinase